MVKQNCCLKKKVYWNTKMFKLNNEATERSNKVQFFGCFVVMCVFFLLHWELGEEMERRNISNLSGRAWWPTCQKWYKIERHIINKGKRTHWTQVINSLLRGNYKEINRIGLFHLGMHDDDGVSTQPENRNTAMWAFIVKHSLQKPCASHPPCIYLYGPSLSLSLSLNLCDSSMFL